MNARARRRHRRNQVIAVAVDMRRDSEDGHGLDPHNFEVTEVKQVVEDCVGFELTEPEWQLAVVAFNEGEATAKASIWYK